MADEIETVQQLREALDLLRPTHHTPYADEDHQGSNCVDLTMTLLGRAYRPELALTALREWCDRTEAETREWMARHNPDCECEVGETYLNAVEEVRSLLPPVPEAAEGVNPLGTRVTRGGTDSGNYTADDDRDLRLGGGSTGN